MAALDELYRETILEHNRNPRHFGQLAPPCEHAQGFNALCGDKVELYFRRNHGHFSALQFTGVGCALSQASASMLCEQLQTASIDQARQMLVNLEIALHNVAHSTSHDAMDNTLDTGREPPSDQTKLPATLMPLAAARRFPSRTKCVLLPWQTLIDALADDDDRGGRTGDETGGQVGDQLGD